MEDRLPVLWWCIPGPFFLGLPNIMPVLCAKRRFWHLMSHVFSFWTLAQMCLQDQTVTRRVCRAEFWSSVTASVWRLAQSRCHSCSTHLSSDKKPGSRVFIAGFTTPFAYIMDIYMVHNDKTRYDNNNRFILRITFNWPVCTTEVTRPFFTLHLMTIVRDDS